jgi:hypothetical protein
MSAVYADNLSPIAAPAFSAASRSVRVANHESVREVARGREAGQPRGANIEQMTSRRRIHAPKAFGGANQGVKTQPRIFKFRVCFDLLSDRLDFGFGPGWAGCKQNRQGDRHASNTPYDSTRHFQLL